jgi:hypothetical protein
MTSIIKVDTIQTAAGGTPTASSLGISGTGKIGQVIQGTTSTSVSSSSTSYATTGFSQTITPSSTSSKIFIICNINATVFRSGNYIEGLYRLYRGGSALSAEMKIGGFAAVGNSSELRFWMSPSFNLLDSPSSTSELTYELYFRTGNGTSETNTFCDGRESTITLMEVLV